MNSLAALCTDEQSLVVCQIQLRAQVMRQSERTGGLAVDIAEDIHTLLEAAGGNPALLLHQPLIIGGITQGSQTSGHQATGSNGLGAGKGIGTAQDEGHFIAAQVDGHITSAGDVAAVGGGSRGTLAVLHQHVGPGIQCHTALQAIVIREICRILQLGAAFNVFLVMLHTLAHHEGAALLHHHIARKACMAAQFKSGAVLHGYIHDGIGIVPVHGIHIAILVRTRGRTAAVHRIGAHKHHRAVAHR